MAKVRTFSRTFPPTHIHAGMPTFFVEKILNGLEVDYKSDKYATQLLDLNAKSIVQGKLSFEDIESFWLSLQHVEETKYHTVRSGFTLKAGEWISPRVWFGAPYRSPQIIIYNNLEVKSCQEFYRDPSGNWLADKCVLSGLERIELAIGDGLQYKDMLSWFNREFHGQIICWTENCWYGS